MYRAVQCGARVEALINMKVDDGERSRSHGLRSDVIDAQARALGVKLEGAATSWDDYEDNFIAILQRLKDSGIEAGIFGDIDLQAHLDWEQMVCHRVGMSAVLPLWQGARMDLMREFVGANFETRIVAVQAKLLAPDVLGQIYTLDLARDFESRGIDACGENGEFHTVVTNGPLFQHPVEIRPGTKVLRDGYWFLDFEVQET
jgi:uncharacterized protein (TIGR00290 family)